MSNELKRAECKRCAGGFFFWSEEYRFRHYCDKCDPIVKAEHKAATAQRLKARVAKLQPSEQTLGRGLLVDVVRTHAEVAKILGISAECVRQTEVRALLKARRLFSEMAVSLDSI